MNQAYDPRVTLEILEWADRRAGIGAAGGSPAAPRARGAGGARAAARAASPARRGAGEAPDMDGARGLVGRGMDGGECELWKRPEMDLARGSWLKQTR